MPDNFEELVEYGKVNKVKLYDSACFSIILIVTLFFIGILGSMVYEIFLNKN